MNNPIEELGKMMNDQMKNVVKRNTGITLELGVIGSDLSLKVSSLGNAIPKGDYMVSLRLTIKTLELQSSEVELTTDNATVVDTTHKHSIKEHKHTVNLPKQLRTIQGGDRVLVAWVGTEPVVVDILVSS